MKKNRKFLLAIALVTTTLIGCEADLSILDTCLADADLGDILMTTFISSIMAGFITR